jgi:hypothetical protein
MPTGYLENDYLSELSDELGADMDASGATMPLTPAAGEPPAPPADVVMIGKFAIKRTTLYLSILVVLLVIVFAQSKKKRRADA